MNENENFLTSITPDGAADLTTVLAAWNTATVRLQETHEALRSEVRRLTDELEVKNRELARKNRLADLGQMASHIAHEVRNNLVPVTLYLSLLRRRLSDDSGSRDILDKVGAGCIAMDATVNDLLNFASESNPQLRSFTLDKLADDVLGTLAPQLSAGHISTKTDIPRALGILADYGMLRRAILNLALNAIDAMPDGGELNISACAGRHGCEIEVCDTGPGLTDEAPPGVRTVLYHQEQWHRSRAGNRLSDCRSPWRRDPGRQLPRGGRRVHVAPSSTRAKGGCMKIKHPSPETPIAGARVLVIDDHAPCASR